MTNSPERQAMANAVRALAMDAVEAAKSGHPGMPMGMADAATALFADHLNFDAADPHWPDRDRFVLSAGHGSMLIYALLRGHGTSTVVNLPCALALRRRQWKYENTEAHRAVDRRRRH